MNATGSWCSSARYRLIPWIPIRYTAKVVGKTQGKLKRATLYSGDIAKDGDGDPFQMLLLTFGKMASAVGDGHGQGSNMGLRLIATILDASIPLGINVNRTMRHLRDLQSPWAHLTKYTP